MESCLIRTKLFSDPTRLDQAAIATLGISGQVLMEEAGRQVAQAVQRYWGNRETAPHVVILCGPGNNGGDGYVCARHLTQTGEADVTVVHTARAEALKGDALLNFERLKHTPVKQWHLSTDPAWEADMATCLQSADVLVDALFGNGLNRPLKPGSDPSPAIRLIQLIRQTLRTDEFIHTLESQRPSKPYCIAVDIPSGISAKTGQALGMAIPAHETVTFAVGKPGLWLAPGKFYAGKIHIVNIGIPQTLVEAQESVIRLIGRDDIQSLLQRREPGGHKYTFGSVLVMAGSRDMPGAPMLVSEAVLRAGAGMVTLACPKSVFKKACPIPEVIPHILHETKTGRIEITAMETLTALVEKKKISTIAIGPGLGFETQPDATDELLHHFSDFLQWLTRLNMPVIMDADGLNALSQIHPLPHLGPNFILTPHIGEAARLLKVSSGEIQNDLIAATQQLREKTGAQIVLKSASTVVFGTSGLCWINPTGNSGMATAGSGDVLTGIISGFAAQKISPEQAAIMGVYLHGLAGDIGAEQLTPFSLIAGDLIRFLPDAIHATLNLSNLPPLIPTRGEQPRGEYLPSPLEGEGRVGGISSSMEAPSS